MDIPVNCPYEASYVKSGDGHILCTHFIPEGEQKDTLIFLPSVAEEMNRCRVMVAMQARCLAQKGIGVVLVDYYGTGDSQGHFKDTDWDIWKRNVLDVCEWVEEKNLNVLGLWGLRMGALLAAEVNHDNPGRFKKLVLWQPVISGKTYMTQLFRMRMARQMDGGSAIEKPDEVRARIQHGEAIEIGGYLYSAQLAAQLDSKELMAYNMGSHVTVDWFESIRSREAAFPVGSQKLHQQWLESGVDLSVHSFVGDAFWQMPERALAPELIDITTRTL